MFNRKIWVLRAGFVVALLGLAACGTGYREGAAADTEPGSEAHGEAIVAIAREMRAGECKIGSGAGDSCRALYAELTSELLRCYLNARGGCDDTLEHSLEGEPDEVSAYVACVASRQGCARLR